MTGRGSGMSLRGILSVAVAVSGPFVVASCGGGSAPTPGPPAPERIQEGLTREWVYNPFDSETWAEAFERAANDHRFRRRTDTSRPPAELASLLGAAARMDIGVTPDAVRIERDGLSTVEVALDGRTTFLEEDESGIRVVGIWHDDAIRLTWDFGGGRTVLETWRLAETGERVVIERAVDIPGGTPMHVTFVQVYDRDRSAPDPGEGA